MKEELGITLNPSMGKLAFSALRKELDGIVFNDIKDVWLFNYDGETDLKITFPLPKMKAVFCEEKNFSVIVSLLLFQNENLTQEVLDLFLFYLNDPLTYFSVGNKFCLIDVFFILMICKIILMILEIIYLIFLMMIMHGMNKKWKEEEHLKKKDKSN